MIYWRVQLVRAGDWRSFQMISTGLETQFGISRQTGVRAIRVKWENRAGKPKMGGGKSRREEGGEASV